MSALVSNLVSFMQHYEYSCSPGYDKKTLCLDPQEFKNLQALSKAFEDKHAKLENFFKGSVSICSSGGRPPSCSRTYIYPQLSSVFYNSVFSESIHCGWEPTSTNPKEFDLKCSWTSENVISDESSKERIVELKFDGSSKIPEDNLDEIPVLSAQTAAIKTVAGIAGAVFFGVKAYKEFRRWSAQKQQKLKTEEPISKAPNQANHRPDQARSTKPEPKASGRKALGYVAAAVGSATYACCAPFGKV